MGENVLTLNPNPVTISKSGSIQRGAITLKNHSLRKALFQAFFDPEIFCSVSPACGQLESYKSQTLSFSLEKLDQDVNEVTFNINYCFVPDNSTQDAEIQMFASASAWSSSLKATILFASHAEESMKSIASSFKRPKSLQSAINKNRKDDLEEQKHAMLERMLAEKEATKIQLEEKIRSLQEQLEQKGDESKKLSFDNSAAYKYVYIAFIVLFLSIFRRMFL